MAERLNNLKIINTFFSPYYRERNLLYRPDISAALDRQFILCSVAHELAYLWFGNLVSPELWNYMWLHKAIATYFMYYVPSQASIKYFN